LSVRIICKELRFRDGSVSSPVHAETEDYAEEEDDDSTQRSTDGPANDGSMVG